MTEKSAADVAAECRLVADALDALPEGTPLPTHVDVHTFESTPAIKWLLFDGDIDSQADTARAVMQTIGGDWTAGIMVDLFAFRLRFHGVQLDITVAIEVACRRVMDKDGTVTWEYEPLLDEVSA